MSTQPTIGLYMGVSKKNGTPKSSICSSGFPFFSPSKFLWVFHPYFWKHPHRCQPTIWKLKSERSKLASLVLVIVGAG